MPRKPYAEIPGHKKFDADLADLLASAIRLTKDAEAKLALAKKDDQRQMFETVKKSLAEAVKNCSEARRVLWDSVV